MRYRLVTLSVLFGFISLTEVYPVEVNPEQEYRQKAEQAKARFIFDEAIGWYQKLTEIAPEQPAYFVELGKAWIASHQPDRAKEAFEAALTVDPSNADAHTLLAVYFHDEKQDNPSAIKHLRQAIGGNSEIPGAYLLLVEIYIDESMFDQAVALLDSLEQMRNRPTECQFFRGKIAFLQKNYTDAERHLSVAAQNGQDKAETHRLLGMTYQHLDQPEAARKAVERFQALKKSEQEQKHLFQLLRISPKDPNRWFAFGLFHLKTGEHEKAVSILQKGLELAPKTASIQSLTAKLLLKLQKPDQALPHAMQAVELLPGSAEDWNNLGACYLMLNQRPDAEKAFRQGLAIDPDNPLIINNLNTIYRDK